MHTTSSRPCSPTLNLVPSVQPFKPAKKLFCRNAPHQGLNRAERLEKSVRCACQASFLPNSASKSGQGFLRRANLSTNLLTSQMGAPNLLQVMANCGVCATSEAYQTFTNREGKVLTDIAENVWAAERPFKWNGIDVNGRMAVLRLKDGGLWVQSPVGLDKNLKDALAKLGPVKHIVSPNYEHIKFAKQWQEAYPDAKLYACPGLQDKSSDVKYDRELSSNELSPPEWLGEVECACLSYERNPFTGSPFFNEAVFHHKPSQYMIVTDLWWQYPKTGTPKGTQLWKFGMDRIYGPFYRSFMIGDKNDFRKTTQTIFNSWNFEGIIPCHGDVLQSGGKAVLKQHLGLAS